MLSAVVMSITFGCGPTAYKITPIPVSEDLREKVVLRDPGFVADKIALVDIDGLIFNYRKSSSLLGPQENPVALTVAKLRKAAADSSVKAVVLRINSPGGTVTASDMIYKQVKRIRKGTDRQAGKPVVAMMMDVGASGGYYIACGADRIVAEPTTITGSIGVVMHVLNIKGLFDKLGISAETIKSGQMKDAGSLFRKLTEQEQKVFQDIIDEFYGRFIEVVKTGRPEMPEEKIKEIADGRVFSGQQAKELGLIDNLGDLRTAIGIAKQYGSMEKARVVMYHRPVEYRGNIYSRAENPTPVTQFNLLNITIPELAEMQTPQFMYLWTGL